MGTTNMAKNFPQVQPGGSLILAWQIKGKKVLVVGGGEVAAGRILNCLDADAVVHVVCPASGLNDEVAHRVAQNQVTHVDRIFEPSDLDGADHGQHEWKGPRGRRRHSKVHRESAAPE